MAAKEIDQNEMIASIMQTLTQKISNRIDQKFDDFATHLSSIERSQENMKKEIKDVKLRVESCTKEAMNAFVSSKEMKQKLKEFDRKLQVKDDKIDDLEQYGRKCMIEVSAFPRLEGENVEKLPSLDEDCDCVNAGMSYPAAGSLVITENHLSQQM
eukprot:gene4370-4951_t